MTERLTKRSTDTTHENGVCCTHFNGKECQEVQGNCAYGCKWEEAAWSKLAHYEDLEEQGRLVVLPAENNFKRDELDRCIHRHCNKCDGYRKEIERHKGFWKAIVNYLVSDKCPYDFGLKGFNEEDCKVDNEHCKQCWEKALKGE